MIKKIKDPGVGFLSDEQARRFIDRDGSFNIKHINRPSSFTESYNYLITISWTRFFVLVTVGYILLNYFFGIIYLILGIKGITVPTGNIFKDFLNAFFFSAQTVTTVGYGAMSPKGIWFGVISTFEAMIGLLSFSFITGLLYGRFSRPRPNIQFTKVPIIRPHKDKMTIMFRLMSKSTNVMIRPRIEVTLALSQKDQEGKYKNNFFRLKLERDRITYLPTTWTIVHPINEESPLKNYNHKEITQLHGEILILVSYYDESFTQEVHQVHSYLLNELQLDKKFIPAFDYDQDGQIQLDHDKLDQVEDL